MIKLLKGIWRGFFGGPDYNKNVTYQLTLENKQLEVELPCEYPAAYNHADLCFPYQSKEWFEENSRVEGQHKFFSMMVDSWDFSSLLGAYFFYRVYGSLQCSLRLKKTDGTNILDKEALSKYVIQAYDDFYNGPEGINTELRQLTNAQLQGVLPAHLEAETMARIHVYGYPPIPAATMKSINQVEWVFYQEIKDTSLERKDFYCLPLNEDTFLEIQFHYFIQKPKRFKRWDKHALVLQERIMGSIRLSDIADKRIT